MLHRFGKSHRAGAGTHHTVSAAPLRRTKGLASSLGPLRANSAKATASSTASAAGPASRPQLSTTLNGLFRAPHQLALRRLFSSASSRAAASSSSSASAASGSLSASGRAAYSKVGGALVAATLMAAGVSMSHKTARAEESGDKSSGAVTLDPPVLLPGGAPPADLPTPKVSLRNKNKQKGKKADSEEVRVDPVAPSFAELGQGSRTVTEFNTWNGIDLKFAYSPLPPDDSPKKTKDFSLVHHIALGSPQSKEEEPTAVYDLTAVVALGSEGSGEPPTQLQAKVSDGGVEGMVRTTLFGHNRYVSPLSTQVQFALTGEDSQPVGGSLETNYHGRGYVVDASYRLRPSVGQLAFVQNIPVKSWKCSLGAEFGHAFDSQNSALSYAGRAADPKGLETYSFTLQPWTYSILSYQRRFDSTPVPGAPPSGVTLASDLHYSMADHIAMVSAGVLYQLPGAFNVKAMANTNQQIASSLEAMLGPAVSIGVCGDIKHAENKYAFGMSLGFGGG